MIDNLNPTNQFHPYLPVRDTPQSEMVRGGLSNVMNRARMYARRKPGIALGALAVLAIGAGLMRRG